VVGDIADRLMLVQKIDNKVLFKKGVDQKLLLLGRSQKAEKDRHSLAEGDLNYVAGALSRPVTGKSTPVMTQKVKVNSMNRREIMQLDPHQSEVQ
jgi:hypothetical protein